MPLEPRTLLTFFPERTVAEPSSEMQSTTRGLLVAALILLPHLHRGGSRQRNLCEEVSEISSILDTSLCVPLHY